VHEIADLQNATHVGMALDLQNGTVTRRFQLAGCQVDVSSFAHRSIRHLMVVSIVGSRFTAGAECVVRPTTPAAPSTLNQQHCHTEGDITTCNVTALVPETARQAPTVVAIHATALPPSLTLSAAAPQRALVAAFATSLEPSLSGQQTTIETAKARYDAVSQQTIAELSSSHALGWASLWESDLQIGGNVSATASLRSSLYYILSSVRDDWAYGSSPGGLPSTSYHGHCFWDMETWFYPPLVVTQPSIATAITTYRQRMVPEAHRLATATGYAGARFPWQSAVTGAECSPRAYNDSLYWTKEVHITPDIVLSHRLLYRLSNNDTWLKTDAWPLLSGACQFLASMVTLDKGSGNYTVMHVLPTTEAGFRDHPAYTTAATSLSMQFCVESAARLNLTVPANWSAIAARPYLPLNSTAFKGGPVHQVYSPYDGGHLAQAGVALLQYPLQFPMDEQLAKRDLSYYGQKFDFGMMFFGRLTYAINWLRFGRSDLADAVFDEGFLHQLGPWNVWRELAAPISTGGGAVNFLTGAGAFLQAFLYGYIGLSPQEDHLRLNPVLPAHAVNISATKLSYSECEFGIFVNASHMRFTTRSSSSSACSQIELTDSSNTTHALPAGASALVLPIGRATLRHKTDDDLHAGTAAAPSTFSSSSTLSVLADADFPQAGAAMFRRLSASDSADDDVPTPTYITTNPLKDLPALSKVHHSCEGIDPSYLNGPWPHSNWTQEDSWAMLVDYARITGAFPSMKDAAGTLDTAVQICINATKQHPDHRQPYLYLGGSPWIVDGVPVSDPTNTSGDAAEVKKWGDTWRNASRLLAESNARLGADVHFGHVQFDMESLGGWSPSWIGKPGKGGQAIIDAIRRKNELVFNVTRDVFPNESQTTILYFDFGAASWLPTGSTDGCYNLQGNGVTACSNYPGSCPDGWCTGLGFTFNESFVKGDAGFAGASVNLYEAYEPQFTRQKFDKTAQNAKALGLDGQRVTPVVSLGCSYHRNTSHAPDINAKAKEMLGDHPFFDTYNFDFSACGWHHGKCAAYGGYDPAFSSLMGAQINQPQHFNSTGAWSALGEWERSAGATFFPSVFSLRSAPSL
jgi:trehalose/maltose hydrolase-like predicted phosphorylase